MVNTLCIVQARLTSSRLPNKVLMPLGNSQLSILEHVFQRLSKSLHINQVVFAIPDSPLNDRLAAFMDSTGIERSVTNAVKVKCGAAGCRPYVVKDAKRRVDFAEPWQTCWDYKPRKGAR